MFWILYNLHSLWILKLFAINVESIRFFFIWLGHQSCPKFSIFWIYFFSSKMLKNTWKKHMRLFIDLLVKNTLIAQGRVLNRWSRITFGQMHSFSSSGSGDTDRWHINEGLCATCQCPRCPNLEKWCICPEVIQLLLLAWGHQFAICNTLTKTFELLTT